MDVKTVGIVGTGQMATGIAEVMARAGVRTIIRGRQQERADASLAAIRKSLERAVERGKATVMKLVEVVPTLLTEEDVTRTCHDLCEKAGKTAVLSRDRSGFIVNALLFPYLNHAVRMYEAGYASKEDIDAAMMSGCGHPMGPLALLDLVGNDVSLEIIESLYREFRDPFIAPAPLLKQMVSAGLLGRKSGRGFYDYSKK